MTAVASPPSIQPLPSWEAGKNGGDSLDAMTSEDVSRILMPQKNAPRSTNGASQLSNSTSSQAPPRKLGSTAPDQSISQVNGESVHTNSEDVAWNPRKKPAKFWPPNSKATNSNQAVQMSSGQSAAAALNNATQQQAPSTQNAAQQNGVKSESHSPQGQAVLALQPLTGTFERKHILVPFFPDVQKIGRQTNQKTVPAASNGYFDSKVLSRQHAEMWAERNGKIWIRDVKSSNGTFVNGARLSPEGKDSEPHELREGDTLELGIDIVSEDQKSIVHHKVSAKVELAGLYNNAASFLDMMQLDPSANPGMLADANGQQISHLRGRGGSQGSIGGINRMSGSHLNGGVNGLGPQRQVNMWMGPITMEQVVKKLTTELKQAKQQSQELYRTSDLFTSLLNAEQNAEPPKSPPKNPVEEKPLVNGLSATSSEQLPPFYQPPAPPPSQPLPAKPDSISSAPESWPQFNLKRTETEKAPLFSSSSPTKSSAHQDSNILSLLDALKLARQEISTQGTRMKHLETALAREKKAREVAERRARALSGESSPPPSHPSSDTDELDTPFEPPLDSLELIEQDLPNGHVGPPSSSSALLTSPSMETLKDAPTSPTDLADRYDLLKLEFAQMKNNMEEYKRRAEEAEASQRRFASLIDSSARGTAAVTGDHGIPKGTPGPGSVVSQDSTLFGDDYTGDTAAYSGPDTKDSAYQQGLSTLSSLAKQHDLHANEGEAHLPAELERTLSTVLEAQKLLDQQRRGEKWRESAPYASIVGVVFIGVGIMTWLNSWNKSGGGAAGGVLE